MTDRERNTTNLKNIVKELKRKNHETNIISYIQSGEGDTVLIGGGHRESLMYRIPRQKYYYKGKLHLSLYENTFEDNELSIRIEEYSHHSNPKEKQTAHKSELEKELKRAVKSIKNLKTREISWY